MQLKNFKELSLLTLVLLITSCASVGNKGEWQLIGQTHLGDITHYVNKRNLVRQGSFVKVSSKNVLKTPETLVFLNGKKYSHDINHWQINCQTKQIKLLAVEFFDQNQQKIYSQDLTAGTKFTSIPNGSVLAGLYNFGCRRKK